MGLFDKMKGIAKFNKVAAALAAITDKIDLYEFCNDSDHLIFAAWICRIGVIDAIEKYGYRTSDIIFVTVNGRLTKMLLYEAYWRSLERIALCCKDLPLTEQEIIQGILEKNDIFYKFDERMPESVRSKYC